MLIKTEDLPSKSVINFYLPQIAVSSENAILLENSADCKSDFTSEVFAVEGVEYCLLAENLVSVKYSDKSDKEVIKALVLACIDDYMQNPLQLSEYCGNGNLLRKCEALADAIIRPTLNRDKGDITISLLGENVLQVQFTGHCAGCPYAQNTLQNVIVKTFKRYLPQIKEVRLKE